MFILENKTSQIGDLSFHFKKMGKEKQTWSGREYNKYRCNNKWNWTWKNNRVNGNQMLVLGKDQ